MNSKQTAYQQRKFDNRNNVLFVIATIFILVLIISGATSCETEYSEYYYYNTASNNASYYLEISKNKATTELTNKYIGLMSDYIICSEKHDKLKDGRYLDTLQIIANQLKTLGNTIIGFGERKTDITIIGTGHKVVNDKGEEITGANSYIVGTNSVASGDVVYSNQFNIK